MSMNHSPLILASSSPYRQALLRQLKLNFLAVAPKVNEQAMAQEAPQNLACRLGVLKAKALQNHYPTSLIIGSDQVASLNEQIIGKPSNRANAIQQLICSAGQCVTFYTSVCVLDSANGECSTDMVTTRVYFKPLTRAQIERYVDIDTPFDCAGSFKVEQLGISLFSKIETEDHTALIGLPLLKLIQLLEKFNINLLDDHSYH